MADMIQTADTPPGSREPLTSARFHVLAALLVGVLGVLWLYWHTGVGMVRLWGQTETYAHGYVVPLVVAWLAWRKRDELSRCALRPTPWFLLVMLAADALWLVGYLGSANSPTHLALIMMLVLLVPAIAGWRAARLLAFPLLFLFFAVPVGDFLLPQLMESTANFTVAALRLTGIPVYQVGQEMVIPTGTWSVVEACSGIRYLIASLMVGALYAYLTYRSVWRRLAFFAFSGVVPIVANWLRAYMIVMIGYLSDNRLATGVDHIIYGWVFFGLIMVVMFWIGSFWAQAPAEAVVLAAPEHPSRRVSPAYVWLVCALSLVFLSLPRAAEERIVRHDSERSSLPHLATLPLPPGWQPGEKEIFDWKPAYSGAKDELQAAYRQGDQIVGLYVGYYRHQDFAHKMVTSTNVLVRADNSLWKIVGRGERQLDVAGKRFTVGETDLYSEPMRKGLRVLSWYWVDGFQTSSDVAAKLHTSFARLMGRGDDSAVIMVFAPRDHADNGHEALAHFLKDFGPGLETSLVHAREQ